MLHTWGQTMQHHPHVHCVIPGGALSHDRTRWKSCRSGFFLPVQVLSRKFRGKFLDGLKRAGHPHLCRFLELPDERKKRPLMGVFTDVSRTSTVRDVSLTVIGGKHHSDTLIT